MAIGKTTCPNEDCAAEFKRKPGMTACPECECELADVEFKLGARDILINDVPKIAISRDPHGGWRVRVQGRPTVYVSTYDQILRHLKSTLPGIAFPAAANLADLIKIEQETMKLIYEVAKRIAAADRGGVK